LKIVEKIFLKEGFVLKDRFLGKKGGGRNPKEKKSKKGKINIASFFEVI
jgi:hypothetical protein